MNERTVHIELKHGFEKKRVQCLGNVRMNKPLSNNKNYFI